MRTIGELRDAGKLKVNLRNISVAIIQYDSGG